MPSREEIVAGYVGRVARQQGVSRVAAMARAPAGGGLESAAPNKAQARALEGAVKAAAAGNAVAEDYIASFEALILPKLRPALEVQDGGFETDHPLWLMLNTDADIRRRLQSAIPSIGRIELPGSNDYPYGGTGFVVGRNLVMTNRHVAAIFTNGVGDKQLTFKPGRKAAIDFLREHDRPTGPNFAVRRIVMVHPYWDMALLEVEDLPPGHEPLSLSAANVTDTPDVAAIGYPAFDPRNDADTQNDLFQKVFGVKRLQPGKLNGRRKTGSFGKQVSAALHDCSTLGGNSGSAMIAFATGQVLGLHFGGVQGDTNYAVPSWELARDQRLIDAGVNFTEKRPDPAAGDWWGAEQTFVSDPADSSAPARTPSDRPGSASPAPVRAAGSGIVRNSDGSMRITVPIEITVRIAPAVLDGAAELLSAPMDGATEAMVEPYRDQSYGDREGYKSNFLVDAEVAMPKAKDASAVAETRDGKKVLHYQNFSIVMHAKRRLALFTASNVTAEAKLKRPDPDKQYTRRALSGLAESDQERWFVDPRLDEAYQLTDLFYTRDRQAFDKGHIVRREDVAWGKTYAQLRRANGDSYHITNCSPQVAGFNRSANGELNWGDLENHVLKGAKSERYCQFAGPILSQRDPVFIGAAGGRERVLVKIPTRYWKVIVADTDAGLQSFGFMLKQDLDDVAFEEFVPAEFKPVLIRLAEIEQKAGLIFPRAVIDADQFDTQEGEELAFRAGVVREEALT